MTRSTQPRAARVPRAAHVCHSGFVIIVDSSVPTVEPCREHRPAQWLRWKAGAYRSSSAVAA